MISQRKQTIDKIKDQTDSFQENLSETNQLNEFTEEFERTNKDHLKQKVIKLLSDLKDNQKKQKKFTTLFALLSLILLLVIISNIYFRQKFQSYKFSHPIKKLQLSANSLIAEPSKKFLANTSQEKENSEKKYKKKQEEKQFNNYGINYTSREKVPLNRRITVVITVCQGRYKFLSKALQSFFDTSTFPYQAILLVNDGQINQELLNVYEPYKSKNVTLAITGQEVGQIRSIDMIYGSIETPYIFHFQDDCQFLQKGYIQQSIYWLQKDPLLLQPWIQKHHLPLQQKTNKVLSEKWVLTFQPGLKRLSDYKLIGSYGNYTKNKSYGKKADLIQEQLSQFYLKKNYYAIQTEKQYTFHKGFHYGYPV